MTLSSQLDNENGVGSREPQEHHEILTWVKGLQKHRTTAPGTLLPPHAPQCAGCGPTNPAGLGLVVERTEDGVRSSHQFDDRQMGAPGLVHGGMVATAFDDLFGFLLYTIDEIAVTRSLNVDYVRPFVIGQTYTFTAALVEQRGRRLEMSAQAVDDRGQLAGTSSATFVIVDDGHFSRGLTR